MSGLWNFILLVTSIDRCFYEILICQETLYSKCICALFCPFFFSFLLDVCLSDANINNIYDLFIFKYFLYRKKKTRYYFIVMQSLLFKNIFCIV